MGRFRAILERDLRKFIRNPLVVAISLVMPVMYLVILGNSFQGELKRLSLAVVDMDGGPSSTRVMEMLASIEAGPATIRVERVNDLGFAMRGLREGIFKGVLVIPRGFSRDIIRSTPAELGLYLDNVEAISSSVIEAALSGALSVFPGEFVSVRKEERGPVVRSIELYRKIDYDQTLIPGVVIMAIFLGAMTTGAFNLVMDRFLGIEESYLLTPLTRFDIVGGLVVSGLMITTVLSLLVLLAGSLVSGIPLWRLLSLQSGLLVLVVIMLSTLGLQGLMFVIMGRLNHPRVVGILSGFLNVIFFFPSGAIYPVESFPGWLRTFARVNPEFYSVHALRSLLFKGVGVEAIGTDLLFLGIFAAVSVVLGMITFKRVL